MFSFGLDMFLIGDVSVKRQIRKSSMVDSWVSIMSVGGVFKEVERGERAA